MSNEAKMLLHAVVLNLLYYNGLSGSYINNVIIGLVFCFSLFSFGRLLYIDCDDSFIGFMKLTLAVGCMFVAVTVGAAIFASSTL